MKKLSTITYKELYDLVVTKGGVKFYSKPRRIDLELALDEIDKKLLKDVEIDKKYKK